MRQSGAIATLGLTQSGTIATLRLTQSGAIATLRPTQSHVHVVLACDLFKAEIKLNFNYQHIFRDPQVKIFQI